MLCCRTCVAQFGVVVDSGGLPPSLCCVDSGCVGVLGVHSRSGCCCSSASLLEWDSMLGVKWDPMLGVTAALFTAVASA
jgi:hypothetical protein